MLPKLAQLITANIDEIARRWVESLRRTERTEVHKTMLTAEIISGTKGMLASLASAIAEEASPEYETIPGSLIMQSDPALDRATEVVATSRESRRRSQHPGGPLGFAQEAAAALGKLRQQQKYEIHEVLLEFVLLRQALWDTLRAAGPDADLEPTFDLPRYLDRLFDELLLHTVEAFYESSLRDLEKRALRDPLTQLYNKEYFAQRLHEELRRALRFNQPLTLAMIDMDRLKELNDTYGHQVGDAAIKSVTQAICDTCRQIDIPCRYGGDEFAVILPETTRSQAAAFGARALNTIHELKLVVPHLDGAEERPEGESQGRNREPVLISAPTISIGLASFPDDGRNPETLISKADAALYQAKRKGRDTVSG